MRKYRYAGLTGCVVGMMLLAACGQPAELPPGVESEDLEAAWETSAATVVLAQDNIQINGEGASADGSVLTVTAEGTYVLSGSLTDGCVVVDAPEDALVRLVLNGVDIRSDSTAPISCTQAEKVIVTLAEGANNVLVDAEEYFYRDVNTDEPDAALFSQTDLTINGTGSLNVTAQYHDGIGTKDDLVIVSGRLTVDAANHAVCGRDSVTVLDGGLYLDAGADGIQSDNDEDETKGWISLYGGNYAITSANDGIQAETALTVDGGSFMITSGGGYTNPLPEESDDSCKGLKSGAALTVYDGTFVLDCADDALYARDLTVNGGSLTLSSGDDALHADSALVVIGDLQIDIQNSVEGIEGATVHISGGTINVNASDDGINAASDEEDADCWIFVDGGDLRVSAGADGLDANGDLTIAGGTVTFQMPALNPAGSGEGMLDADGTVDIPAGTVLGAGGNGLVTVGGSVSSVSQGILLVLYSETQLAGTTVELQDASGAVVASLVPDYDFTCILFSTPDLAEGDNCSVYTGGEKTVDVTLSGTVTSIRDTGEEADMGMPGGMPPGELPEGMPAPPEGMSRPEGEPPAMPEGASRPEGMQPPPEGTPPTLPEGASRPEGMQPPPEGGMSRPEGEPPTPPTEETPAQDASESAS